MSQHDLVIDNATFPAVRSDLNGALQALGSTSKGNSRPSTVYAGQLWIDDNTPSSTVWSVYFYDGTDDIKVGEIDSTANNFMPFVNGSSLTSFLSTYTFPGTEDTLASASTTDLGSTGVFAVSITGTTTINSLGSSASTSAPLYFIRFTGALTLTHNATSLILPGGANITTAAGATAIMLYLGSGNWRMLSYEPALTASRLIGVGATGGKAAIQLGTNLSMSGTTLNAAGGSGTVTSVATNNGLTGGTITTSGTIGIDTNNALGVGAYAILQNVSGVTINNGATASAADLNLASVSGIGSGGVSGTWRNVSYLVNNGQTGLFIRTA